MRRGFTFVELLLAISIFSIIAVVVYSAFSMGINAWRKMDGLLEGYQQIRLVTERMAWELRNCVDIENFNPQETEVFDFKGEKEKDRIIFFSIKEDGIRRILYQKKENKDFEDAQNKELEIFSLERLEQDFLAKPLPEDRDAEVVLSLVRDVQFRYLDFSKEKKDGKVQWQDSWGAENEDFKKLPNQVWIRLVVLLPTGRKQDEYQEVVIDRYVDIPSSPRPQI
jgi:prepilin-type N-terminal cleavage/methylation domain-containing protein